jgi:hypothetical protein
MFHAVIIFSHVILDAVSNLTATRSEERSGRFFTSSFMVSSVHKSAYVWGSGWFTVLQSGTWPKSCTGYGLLTNTHLLIGSAGEIPITSITHSIYVSMPSSYGYIWIWFTRKNILVAIKVSKDLYTDDQGISQNVTDIKKYTPIIDAAVETLI